MPDRLAAGQQRHQRQRVAMVELQQRVERGAGLAGLRRISIRRARPARQAFGEPGYALPGRAWAARLARLGHHHQVAERGALAGDAHGRQPERLYRWLARAAARCAPSAPATCCTRASWPPCARPAASSRASARARTSAPIRLPGRIGQRMDIPSPAGARLALELCRLRLSARGDPRPAAAGRPALGRAWRCQQPAWRERA